MEGVGRFQAQGRGIAGLRGQISGLIGQISSLIWQISGLRGPRDDGRTDGRMDKWMNESPLVFYRTSSPSGPLPKNRRFVFICNPH